MDARGLSAVSAIADLAIGESVCRSRLITADHVNSRMLQQAKRDLMNSVAKAVSRAKLRRPGYTYQVNSLHHFTQMLDLIVVVVVTRL